MKANYVTTLREGGPNSMSPPNAPHKCGLFLPLLSFTASQDSLHARKRRKKMGGVDLGLGGRNRDVKVRAGTSGDASRKCSEG